MLREKQTGGERRLYGYEILGNPADGQHLEFDATNNRFIWVGAGGPTITIQESVLTGDDTTTSTSYVATSLSLTLANRPGGFAICLANLTKFNNGTNNDSFTFFDDGVIVGRDVNDRQASANFDVAVALFHIAALDGSVIDVRMKTSAGTLTLNFNATRSIPNLLILEIS